MMGMGSGDEQVEEVGDKGADVSELVRLIPPCSPLRGFRFGTRTRPGVLGERARIGERGEGRGGGFGCVAARTCN